MAFNKQLPEISYRKTDKGEIEMLNLGDKVVLLKEYEPKTTNKNKEILIEGSIGTICDILSNDAVYVEFDQNEYTMVKKVRNTLDMIYKTEYLLKSEKEKTTST